MIKAKNSQTTFLSYISTAYIYMAQARFIQADACITRNLILAPRKTASKTLITNSPAKCLYYSYKFAKLHAPSSLAKPEFHPIWRFKKVSASIYHKHILQRDRFNPSI